MNEVREARIGSSCAHKRPRSCIGLAAASLCILGLGSASATTLPANVPDMSATRLTSRLVGTDGMGGRASSPVVVNSGKGLESRRSGDLLRSLPAVAVACGACDQTLELTLTTDDYGSETTWRLVEGTAATGCAVGVGAAGGELAAGGPYRNQAGSGKVDTFVQVLSTTLCAHQEYSFELLDSGGDGICCDWGSGSFSLSLDGAVVAPPQTFTGGSALTKFVAPPAPTFPPTPLPAPLPTPAPSTPTPHPSSGPTPLCGAGCGQTLKLLLATDSYGMETTWQLRPAPSTPPEGGAGQAASTKAACAEETAAVVSGGPYGNVEGGERLEVVVSTGLCAGKAYEFQLFDSAGDGLCCGQWGNGSFALEFSGGRLVNDEAVVWPQSFTGASSSVVSFVVPTAPPTPLPTAAPLPLPTNPPTAQPTLPPTPRPSRQPSPQPTHAPQPQPSARPAPEPTAAKSLVPAPTVSTAGSTGEESKPCAYLCDQALTVSVATDSYGSETSWTLAPVSSGSGSGSSSSEVEEGAGDQVAMNCALASAASSSFRGGPYRNYHGGEAHVHVVQGLCAHQEYVFTVLDSAGDGWCSNSSSGGTSGGGEECEWGQGSFSLALEGAALASERTFTGASSTVSFTPGFRTFNPTSLPTLHPSPAPSFTPTALPAPAPTPPPTQKPVPAPTQDPSAKPTLLPTRPLPTFSPSLQPTHSRTPSPNPSLRPSARPTLESCGDCADTLTLHLRTDTYADETSFSLMSNFGVSAEEQGCAHHKDFEVSVAGPLAPGYRKFNGGEDHVEVLTTTACRGKSYTLTLFDSNGDGIATKDLKLEAVYGHGSFWLELTPFSSSSSSSASASASEGEAGTALVPEGTTFYGASWNATFTVPTPLPTLAPSPKPTTAQPSAEPSFGPSARPTVGSGVEEQQPSPAPTPLPTTRPLPRRPTRSPTQFPTRSPSLAPSKTPSASSAGTPPPSAAAPTTTPPPPPASSSLSAGSNTVPTAPSSDGGEDASSASSNVLLLGVACGVAALAFVGVGLYLSRNRVVLVGKKWFARFSSEAAATESSSSSSSAPPGGGRRAGGGKSASSSSSSELSRRQQPWMSKENKMGEGGDDQSFDLEFAAAAASSSSSDCSSDGEGEGVLGEPLPLSPEAATLPESPPVSPPPPLLSPQFGTSAAKPPLVGPGLASNSLRMCQIETRSLSRNDDDEYSWRDHKQGVGGGAGCASLFVGVSAALDEEEGGGGTTACGSDGGGGGGNTSSCAVGIKFSAEAAARVDAAIAMPAPQAFLEDCVDDWAERGDGRGEEEGGGEEASIFPVRAPLATTEKEAKLLNREPRKPSEPSSAASGRVVDM